MGAGVSMVGAGEGAQSWGRAKTGAPLVRAASSSFSVGAVHSDSDSSRSGGGVA